MLPYTDVIAGASTNVTTPTTEEIDQGNNQLTPYNSAVNNGYYRLMSQGVADLSSEIQSVIVAAGLTPSASDQLLTALNILYPDVGDLGSAAYVDTGTSAGDVPLNSTLSAQRFESSEQTITFGGSLTIAHGLGAIPKNYKAFLVCKTAGDGYSVGDVTDFKDFDANDNGPGYGCQIIPDSTNLFVRFGSLSTRILDKSSGTEAGINSANWKAVFRASTYF